MGPGSDRTARGGGLGAHGEHLSIVVPTRDTATLTLACLASIDRARGSRDVEVIVVDDASRDDTVARIQAAHPALAAALAFGLAGVERTVLQEVALAPVSDWHCAVCAAVVPPLKKSRSRNEAALPSCTKFSIRLA